MKLSRFWLTLAVTALFSSAGTSADPAGAPRPEVRRLLPEEFWSTDPLDRVIIGGDADTPQQMQLPFGPGRRDIQQAAVLQRLRGTKTNYDFLETLTKDMA